VYKTDDLRLEHPVALKFLPETLSLSPAALSRFHAEVRIGRQVSHPNVCRIYDVGDVDGLNFPLPRWSRARADRRSLPS